MEVPGKEYPERLHHTVPDWVCAGALFHIRIRAAPNNRVPLTEPVNAKKLIETAQYYHEHARWFCRLFLLMPDHLHALLSFPPEARMSRVIGEWKKYTIQHPGVVWQDNYFDHRLRDDCESTKAYAYILQNPMVKGLCSSDQAWPWQWRGVDR